MHLLQSQRNAILSMIVDAGFKRSDFHWGATDGAFSGWPETDVPCLFHTATGFFCAFALAPIDRAVQYATGVRTGDHVIVVGPGRESPREQHSYLSWDNAVLYIRQWLEHLRREIDAPDLWSLPDVGQSLTALAGSSQPNDPFAPGEVARIQQSLADARAEIEALGDVTHEQLEQVVGHLEHLAQASERFGRKDWVNLLLGATVSLVVQTAMPPDVAKAVFQALGRALGWLVAGQPLLQ
jgi:hypothetical protein